MRASLKKLTDEEYMNLLHYCNALEFEPYRGREMSMKDPGYLGYRDEITMRFSGTALSLCPETGFGVTIPGHNNKRKDIAQWIMKISKRDL